MYGDERCAENQQQDRHFDDVGRFPRWSQNQRGVLKFGPHKVIFEYTGYYYWKAEDREASTRVYNIEYENTWRLGKGLAGI